jgi:hypothetical protein
VALVGSVNQSEWVHVWHWSRGRLGCFEHHVDVFASFVRFFTRKPVRSIAFMDATSISYNIRVPFGRPRRMEMQETAEFTEICGLLRRKISKG